jgi:cell division transport system permease protein
MRVFFYSLQTAIKNLWCDKWINFLTTLTVAVGLLILGTFILITVNLDFSLKRWSKGFGLIVYLEETAGKDEEELLKEYFQKDADIIGISYISKDSALDDFRTTLGEMSSILEGFHENPLPASFELKLKRESLEPYYIKQKAYQIGQLNGVDDVQYGEKWLSSLHTMTKGMKIIILFLGGIIFTAIAFTTYSTMKILFYRRIEEVNTLKLLGATRGFIRFPFILEGFFIGIFGGLVGFLGILFIHNLASSKIIEFMPAMNEVIIFLPLESYPVAPLAGALMSIVGSLFAVGKIRY